MSGGGFFFRRCEVVFDCYVGRGGAPEINFFPLGYSLLWEQNVLRRVSDQKMKKANLWRGGKYDGEKKREDRDVIQFAGFGLLCATGSAVPPQSCIYKTHTQTYTYIYI